MCWFVAARGTTDALALLGCDSMCLGAWPRRLVGATVRDNGAPTYEMPAWLSFNAKPPTPMKSRSVCGGGTLTRRGLTLARCDSKSCGESKSRGEGSPPNSVCGAGTLTRRGLTLARCDSGAWLSTRAEPSREAGSPPNSVRAADTPTRTGDACLTEARGALVQLRRDE